jgi:hypothetical protein
MVYTGFMEMTGFGQESWHTGLGCRDNDRPEWHVLRARLSAAYAARRAISPHAGGQQGAAGSGPAGSFDAPSARRIAGYEHGSMSVNPTVSGNRNPEPDMGVSAAGTKLTGSRGQI